VTEGNTKVRAALYERFVAVAQNLEKLNNFNGCIAVLTGLQASPIYRLKETQNVCREAFSFPFAFSCPFYLFKKIPPSSFLLFLLSFS
jgi:hypothetical protein